MAGKTVSLMTVLIVVLSLCCPSSRASNDTEVVGLALEGQEFIFERDYKSASSVFDRLVDEYPDLPAGDFGRMAVYEVQMLEREDFSYAAQFGEAAAAGLENVEKILQKYHPTVWDLFLSGSVLGLDGFFKARKGEWWSAYVAGTKSRQLFRRVKEMDPGFIDADFGLGMYLYWRSVYTRDLWFLKIFPDTRQEGIAIIEGVAKNGRFAKDLAKVNLIIVYIEEGRLADARKLLDEYVARYPDNVILRRLLGKVMTSQRQFDSAVAQFRRVLEIDPALVKSYYFIGAAYVLKGDPKQYPEAKGALEHFLKVEGSGYWQASAHYWLGRLAEREGQKSEAIAQYKKALELNPKIKVALERMRGLGGGL